MEDKNDRKSKIVILSFLAILFTLSVGYIVNVFLLSPKSNSSNYKIALNNCSGSNASKCIATYATAIGELEGTEKSLDLVKLLINSRKDLKNGCHSLTHDLGNAFYERFSDKAIVPGHAWCSYGYYHGLMQSYGKGNLSGIVDYAKDLCKKVEGVLNDDCLHGIGHAAYTNLFSIDKSLLICDKIKEYDFALTCSDGVIMEEFMNSTNGLLTSGFEVKDCLNYKNKAVQAGCAKAMAQQNVNIGLSLEESCYIFSEDISNQCTSGYGSSLAGNIASGSTFTITEKQIKSCDNSDGCAQGFGWIAYMYFLDYKKANDLCENNFKNIKYLNTCINSAKLAKDNEDANS